MSILRLAETIGIWKGIADFGAKITVLAIAFLAPLQGLLVSLAILVSLDLITGVLAAAKKKQKITSAKLSRTITKVLVYLFTIMLVEMASKYVILPLEVPLTGIISSFIILTELQSVLENVNKLFRQTLLTVLIDKISLITKGRTEDGRPRSRGKK